MNLKLHNTDYLSTGIFGILTDEPQSFILYTLQHAYPVVNQFESVSTNYAPKIPPGTYTCVRGLHRLNGMTHDFETFEITGVAGHTNLLFHAGNFNKDSEGCVLLGMARQGDSMILNSKEAFEKFMSLQEGISSFVLTVS